MFSEQSNNVKREVALSVGRLLPDFIHIICYPNWNTFENEMGFHENSLVRTRGIINYDCPGQILMFSHPN